MLPKISVSPQSEEINFEKSLRNNQSFERMDKQLQSQTDPTPTADENNQQSDNLYPNQPQPATFRLVFVGDYGYDNLVLFFFIGLLIVFSIFSVTGAAIFSTFGALDIVAIVLLAVILQLIYRLFSLYFFQTTLGMKIAGLKIVSETGERPTLGQLTKRELLKYFTYIPYLFIYWLMPQSVERTPHDSKAGTFVIFDGKERGIFFRPPTTRETYPFYIVISICVIIIAIIFYFVDRSNPYP